MMIAREVIEEIRQRNDIVEKVKNDEKSTLIVCLKNIMRRCRKHVCNYRNRWKTSKSCSW